MAIKKTDEYKNFQIEGVAGIDTEGPYQGLGFFYRTKVTDKKGKLNPSPWTYEDLNPKVQKYFQKIVKYCQDNGIVCAAMPIKVNDLVSTIEMMLQAQIRRRKKLRSQPRKRSPEEQKIIDDAKHLLMERNNMSEQEAFRYIQKCSMDSGNTMVESATMVMGIYQDV